MSQKKLTFIYAYPLDNERRRLFESKNLAYPSRPEIRETLERWHALWDEADIKHDLIEKISQITKRTPTRNLECFVIGAGIQAMSTPFILPAQNKEQKLWSDEKFIEIVIHELLHIFLVTDNEKYWEFAVEKYADEEPVCRNHVLLYAMLYQLYQEVFEAEPLDFQRDNLPPGYAKAVAIVTKRGHEAIIKEYEACQ